MSRFQNVGNRGSEQRKARDSRQMVEGIAIAQRMYLETGGEDIDFGIRSAKLLLKLYEEQLEVGPRPGVATISHELATRTRQQMASFTRQRERKLADLQKRVDESQQAEAERDAESEQIAEVPSAETLEPGTNPEADGSEPANDASVLRDAAGSKPARQAG